MPVFGKVTEYELGGRAAEDEAGADEAGAFAARVRAADEHARVAGGDAEGDAVRLEPGEGELHRVAGLHVDGASGEEVDSVAFRAVAHLHRDGVGGVGGLAGRCEDCH